MSTATATSESIFRGSGTYSEEPISRFTFHAGRNDGDKERLIQYTSAARIPTKSPRKQQKRVLRRLNGFLKEIVGKTAQVTFIENGETFNYEMPSERLLKSGIKAANQPFEMDEVEFKTNDGLFVGYHFRPLAKASDAYVEMLDLDEDRKRKLALILKKFAKA